MKAALIISHGSRFEKTKEEVLNLADKIQKRVSIDFVECAFLEIESPSIPDGIARCVLKGAREIIILLNFLNAGRHVDCDIPRIVDNARNKHPDVILVLTKPIGQNEEIPDLFAKILSSHIAP